MYKKYKAGIGGYFTVEASMIMPLMICLISFLFYFAFYLYDRCIVEQDTYILAFRGSLYCEEDRKEIESRINEKSKDQFGRKYMGINNFISVVQADEKQVTVKSSGTMMPSFVQFLGLQRNWYFEGMGKAERMCPTDKIRKVRLAKKIGAKIQENTQREN